MLILPNDGEVVEDNRGSLLPKAPPILLPTTTTTAMPAAPLIPQNTANDLPSPAADPPAECLMIHIPSKFHPRRALQSWPQMQQVSPHDKHEEPIQAQLQGDSTDMAPQYVGCIHQFPAQLTRSSLVYNAGGGAALIAFGAFEQIEPTPYQR